ncbi:condensation domain-containing protein [Streptomyces sp. NBC_00663]|uniref:condensation domain-containing protein n=1 Tax=Streptomyces sp. NBC_00663 TaxID=2975801 RepID=UPI002E35E98E|nr:condensation domain-containing protein [Streptomyces sp. NBC_00663]
MAVEGGRAYRCGLTWSQRWLYEILGERMFTAPRLNVPLRLVLDRPVALDAALDAVRAAVLRHDTLRTVYPVATGEAGEAGEAEQEIRDTVRCEVLLVETAADGRQQLEEAMSDALDVLGRRPLGRADTPVRFAVLVRHGKAHALVAWIQHMSVDGIGSAVLGEELRRLAQDPDVPLPDLWQTRDLLDFQDSERGRRHARAAGAYQRRQLEQAPLRPAAGSHGHQPLTPRFFEVACDSTAISNGTRILAQRYGVTEEMVLLATVCLVRARLDGHDTGAVTLASSNRFHPKMRGMVANVFQDSPLCLKIGDGGFRDLVHQAAKVSLAAYKYGYFDPREQRDAIAESTKANGRSADFGWSVSLRIADGARLLDGESTETAKRRAAALRETVPLREQARNTKIWQLEGHESRPAEAMFAVWGLGDYASMSLIADSTRYRVEQVTGLLRDFERTVVEAVEED